MKFLRVFYALFWIAVGSAVLLGFAVIYGVASVVDGALAWLMRLIGLAYVSCCVCQRGLFAINPEPDDTFVCRDCSKHLRY